MTRVTHHESHGSRQHWTAPSVISRPLFYRPEAENLRQLTCASCQLRDNPFLVEASEVLTLSIYLSISAEQCISHAIVMANALNIHEGTLKLNNLALQRPRAA